LIRILAIASETVPGAHSWNRRTFRFHTHTSAEPSRGVRSRIQPRFGRPVTVQSAEKRPEACVARSRPPGPPRLPGPDAASSYGAVKLSILRSLASKGPTTGQVIRRVVRSLRTSC
jgi:hypothetical protein